MKYIPLALIFSVLLISCNSKDSNKNDNQDIYIGEHLEIYMDIMYEQKCLKQRLSSLPVKEEYSEIIEKANEINNYIEISISKLKKSACPDTKNIFACENLYDTEVSNKIMLNETGEIIGKEIHSMIISLSSLVKESVEDSRKSELISALLKLSKYYHKDGQVMSWEYAKFNDTPLLFTIIKLRRKQNRILDSQIILLEN